MIPIIQFKQDTDVINRERTTSLLVRSKLFGEYVIFKPKYRTKYYRYA